MTNVVPGFWVPAIGGRRMMLRKLESETRDLFMSVEEKAKGQAEEGAASQP